MAFLELNNIKTHFPVSKGILMRKVTDTIKAVDGIDLSIEEGEILGLVGESGCGKSTLSRTIMQLIPATSGSVILKGEDLSTLTRNEIRKRRLDFQMIFQDPYASLNPRMTINSTLAEAIKQRHKDRNNCPTFYEKKNSTFHNPFKEANISGVGQGNTSIPDVFTLRIYVLNVSQFNLNFAVYK